MHQPNAKFYGLNKTNDVQLLGSDGFSVSTTLTSDNIPLLDRNYVEKMAGDGFSKDRHFQKVASIPYAAYLKAQAEGYDMTSEKSVNKFLDMNPEFQTVKSLYVTPGSNAHRIIIK